MIYRLDPLTDARWADFVERHPQSSVFHTAAWLSALQRTYKFQPLVITSSSPGEALANGIPFCLVRSVLTGNRLVSLPFSDHCSPLASAGELPALLDAARESVAGDRLKYAELRPLEAIQPPGFVRSQRFAFQVLDLRPPLDAVTKRFHRDCVRRKIRRAEREGLTVSAGSSEALLDDFYALQVITRKRHGLPPQPRSWFRNLLDAMGEKAALRVAYASGRAVAAILTLRHRSTEVYKYGCSRAEDNNLGGMQLLLWRAIEDAKGAGMTEMDMGRSDLQDEGVIQFKDRWGAERRDIDYYRYPVAAADRPSATLFGKLPKSVLIAAGKLLYRHMG